MRTRVTEQEVNELLERIQKLMDDTVNHDNNNKHCNWRYMVRLRGGKINPRSKYIAFDKYTLHDDEKESNCGVFCFLVAQNNTSVSMGSVLKGDILKPATYKAPAKYARGNIYDIHQGMDRMKWTGPHYL